MRDTAAASAETLVDAGSAAPAAEPPRSDGRAALSRRPSVSLDWPSATADRDMRGGSSELRPCCVTGAVDRRKLVRSSVPCGSGSIDERRPAGCGSIASDRDARRESPCGENTAGVMLAPPRWHVRRVEGPYQRRARGQRGAVRLGFQGRLRATAAAVSDALLRTRFCVRTHLRRQQLLQLVVLRFPLVLRVDGALLV